MSSTSTAPPRAKKQKTSVASLKPSSSQPPLGKFLASSEKPIRDKAVASLARFLAGTKTAATATTGEDGDEVEELEVGELDWDEEYKVDKRLEKTEMAKLWKGVFYCFWMSDKPLVQQALANALALLVLDVRPKVGKGRPTGRVARFRSAMCYLRGFWEAIVREWAGLDRLRLDKFYLLIRRFVHVAFLLLQRESWDPQAIKEYSDLLTGPGGPLQCVSSPSPSTPQNSASNSPSPPFSVLDSRIPHSLAYHLSDIYLAELSSSLSSPLSPLPKSATSLPIPLISLLQPFFQTLSIAPNSTMFTRISENVFLPILPKKEEPASKRRKVSKEGEEESEFVAIFERCVEGGEVEEKKEKEKKVREVVLKALFEEGGKKETTEVSRRKMYEIYREREGQM